MVGIAHPFDRVEHGREFGLGQDQDRADDQGLEDSRPRRSAGVAACRGHRARTIGPQGLPESTELDLERISPIRLAIVADLGREQGRISDRPGKTGRAGPDAT